MEFPRAFRVEAEVELVLPAELESRLAQGVVAELCAGVALGQVGGVRGDFVRDDAFLYVLFVRQAKVFLGSDIAEHRAAVPADHRRADAAGDVVVAGGDVGRQRAKRVEGSLVAPLELLGHVVVDHVHRNVAGAFVHHLDAKLPGAPGQVALHLELGELRLVVGVGDGAGAEAVADAEAHVVGGADFADVIPMCVEETLGVMREAPLGHDRSAPADDAGEALGCHRHEAQQHAGVNGEIVDTLLGLLDECVAVNLPSQVFGFAVHFLECLINRHSADRDGRVANDPFAGGVDVFSGGKIHHIVGAPLGCPSHFLDLLLDARGDGGVADVGVDLHEEIAADDHRLGFRVVDVGGDDGAAAGDLFADELRRYLVGDVRAPRVAGMLVGQRVGRRLAKRLGVLPELGQAHVFANGDELHFRRDDALFRIPILGDRMAGGGAERLAPEPRELSQPVGFVALGGVVGVDA